MEWLHFHFSLSCIGEGNGNPLQCSCLENPRDGGAWWAPIYRAAQSQTRLKWLSSSSGDTTSPFHLTLARWTQLRHYVVCTLFWLEIFLHVEVSIGSFDFLRALCLSSKKEYDKKKKLEIPSCLKSGPETGTLSPPLVLYWSSQQSPNFRSGCWHHLSRRQK